MTPLDLRNRAAATADMSTRDMLKHAAAEIERLRGDVEGYAKTIRVLRAKVEAAEAALKTALERIEELEDVSHNAYGPDA